MKKLSYQIKLFCLKKLYVFLDILTNITQANPYFVRQKIYIGAAIIAISVTINSCSSAGNHKASKEEKKDSLQEITTLCYKSVVPAKKGADTTKKKILQKNQKIRFQLPHISTDNGDISIGKDNSQMVSCYLVVIPEATPDKLPTENDTLVIVEQMPNFKDGLEAMNQFVSENIKYPEKAIDKGISGRVILQFVITKNGDITNLKVLRSISPELDKEAIRIVKLMPKWNPGKQNGRNVNVQFTLPIIFKLKE